MEENTIKMEIDLYGNPYIVDACATDYDIRKLSTYDYIHQEVGNCGYVDLFSTIEKAGIYKVVSHYDDYPDFILIEEAK